VFVWANAQRGEKSPAHENTGGNRHRSLKPGGADNYSDNSHSDDNTNDAGESDAESNAESEPKPEPKRDPKSGTEPRTKSGAEPGWKSTTDAEAKPERYSESLAECLAEPQPESSSTGLMVLSIRSVLSVSYTDTDNADERKNSYCCRPGFLGRSS
jgi:hypothetical protein